MRSCKLPSGAAMPVLGLGTWRMGESARRRAQELDALKYGLELGYPMIDTAEMYGEGVAEEIVGDAIAGRTPRPFIVSKVYPHNATRSGTIAACERSLKRLRIERIDLYLLHWRGGARLEETFEAFHRLRRDGKDRRFRRQQLRPRRHGRCRPPRQGPYRQQPGALLPVAARSGIRPAALDAPALDPADGLFAARPGRAAAQARPQEAGRRGGLHAGPARTRLADGAAGGRHHPEILQPRTGEGEFRRARGRSSRRSCWPSSTAPSRRPGANRRWRCFRRCCSRAARPRCRRDRP